MNLQYNILFSVFFQHNYYIGNKLKTLKVRPVKKTALDILRHGLFLKPFEGGFHILYSTGKGVNQRSREDVLREPFFLDFIVDNSDHNFFNYTSDFSVDILQHMFCFSNYRDSLSLHAASFVSDEDLYELNYYPLNISTAAVCKARNYCEKETQSCVKKQAEIFFKKPFGTINIKVDGTLAEVYNIKFSARSTYWRYIITSDYLTGIDIENLAVVHKTQQFTVAKNKVLNKYRAFISNQKIELNEKPDKGYQLVDKEKNNPVILMLPNPDVNLVSFIAYELENGDKKIFSEIFL